MKDDIPPPDPIGVHLSHCYMGEYPDSCKYGDDNCPAKPPFDVYWKHDYLDLMEKIEAFEKKRLKGDPKTYENVGKLLYYHCQKARELLWAEVNGGLEEEYQEEADKIPPEFWDRK